MTDIAPTENLEVTGLEKIKEMLPANRIAAISAALVTFLTAFAVFITTIQSSLVPGSPPAEALAKGAVLLTAVIAFILAVTKITTTFLYGAQAFEKQEHELKVLELKGEGSITPELHDPEVDFETDGEEAPNDVEIGFEDEQAAHEGAPPEGDVRKFEGSA